jgi:hypothetical protein
MTSATGRQHERLAPLVGTWETKGWTRELPGRPKARIDATDTYGWLPGRTALLHTVDRSAESEPLPGLPPEPPELLSTSDASRPLATSSPIKPNVDSRAKDRLAPCGRRVGSGQSQTQL